MDITITPALLNGTVKAIPSKSQAHRFLICAALANSETEIACPETNLDIEATINCLNALGATICRTNTGYHVIPITYAPEKATLYCGESGSTLRFLLPIAGALGTDTTFHLGGRLPQRPLTPLWEEMERMGCILSRPTESSIRCTGKLRNGTYRINGSVSSQFISGLLFAMSILGGESRLIITDKLESRPYVEMTRQALSIFSVNTDNYVVNNALPLCTPQQLTVEGDWSNAAFFLTATAIGNRVTVDGLDDQSFQGDKEITPLLTSLKDHCVIDASDIPDLVPILSIAAAANHGATFTNIRRLRLKESDRVAAIIQMLQSFGIKASADSDSLDVFPGSFCGGKVDSQNDHRIAMAAAIAATIANAPVTITNAQCVKKSYPSFWEDFQHLGGNYEQYIR